MATGTADVVWRVDAEDLPAARQTLSMAATNAGARLREMAARNVAEWDGLRDVFEVDRSAAVLADPVCRDAAEWIARNGRMSGYSLVLHGSEDVMWALEEFGGSAMLRDYAQAAPHVTYVEHPSWGQDR